MGVTFLADEHLDGSEEERDGGRVIIRRRGNKFKQRIIEEGKLK